MVYGTIPMIRTGNSCDYSYVYSYSFMLSFTYPFTAYFTVSFAALRFVCSFARSFRVNLFSPTALALGFQSLKEKAD